MSFASAARRRCRPERLDVDNRPVATPSSAPCMKCEAESPRHCGSPTCTWYKCKVCKILFCALSGRIMPGVGK